MDFINIYFFNYQTLEKKKNEYMVLLDDCVQHFLNCLIFWSPFSWLQSVYGNSTAPLVIGGGGQGA